MTGIEHFGAVSSRFLAYPDLDLYGRYVLSAPTLGAALYRGVRALRYIHSHSEVHLVSQGDHLRLQFDPKLSGVFGARHIEEGMPTVLTELVRRFAGPDWAPTWIELTTSSSERTGKLEEIHGLPVRTGRAYPAIAFPKTLLEVKNPGHLTWEPIDLLRDVREMVRSRPPTSAAEMTRDMIELQLRRSVSSIEVVAEALGVGVRTLQRQLMVEATSFQECLAEARAMRARDLLMETALSIAQIAGQLGYHETNSFRRAFRRWFGVSPTQFRECLMARSGGAITAHAV